MDFQEWMNLQESNKVSSLILKLVLYPKQTLVIHDFCLFRWNSFKVKCSLNQTLLLDYNGNHND